MNATSRNLLLTSMIVTMSSMLAPALALILNPPLAEQPWLCAKEGDGSSAKIVNQSGKLQLVVKIAEIGDTGGAMITSVKGLKAKTLQFSVPLVDDQLAVNTAFVYGTYTGTDNQEHSFYAQLGGEIAPIPAPAHIGYCADLASAIHGGKLSTLYIGVGERGVGEAHPTGKTTIENISLDGTPITIMALQTAGCPF